MPCQSNSSWYDHPNNIGWAMQIKSSLLCSFLHSLVTSSLLGPNILLNTLFSNTLSLRSSLNVSNQVSHPYKTTIRQHLKAKCVTLFFFTQNTWNVSNFNCGRGWENWIEYPIRSETDGWVFIADIVLLSIVSLHASFNLLDSFILFWLAS
jgi:hypothetical protein